MAAIVGNMRRTYSSEMFLLSHISTTHNAEHFQKVYQCKIKCLLLCGLADFNSILRANNGKQIDELISFPSVRAEYSVLSGCYLLEGMSVDIGPIVNI